MEPTGSTAPNGLLRCPTPVSSLRPLISHQISQGTCQRRQRELYHKCFLCVNSALQQARFGQMFRERVPEAGEAAPILAPPAWPALPDATLAPDAAARPRAASDGLRP